MASLSKQNAPLAAQPRSATAFGRYVQLAMLVAAAGAIYPMLYLRQVYQGPMLSVLRISGTQLGVLYSILGTTFMFSYMPSGWLADRIAPRILIPFSLIGTGLLGVWYATLPSYHTLLIIFSGFGVTAGLTFWASLLKRVKMIALADEQGRFFGLLDGGRGVIEAILATVAFSLFAYLQRNHGFIEADAFRQVLYLYSFACMALGASLVFVRDPKTSASEKKSSHRAEKKGLIADLKLLASIPELRLVTVIVFCGYHFFWATYSFSAYLGQAEIGLTATAAALATTTKLWMRPIGGIGGGWLGDRFTKLRILTVVLSLAGVGMFILIALPAWGHSSIIVAAVIFTGLMTYAIRGLYWAILDDCDVPLHVTGLAIGVISAIGYSPDAFLPLLNGWMTERFPGALGYQLFFSYVLAVGLMGVVAAVFLQKRISKRASSL